MRRRKTAVWLLAAAIAILVVFHGGGPAAQQESARVPGKIPPEAASRANPVEADRSSVAAGRNLFTSQCTMCHGSEGRGDGDLVERLALEVPDFTDAAWQRARTDGALFYVLSEGHGRMPAQKKKDGSQRFDETTRWNLVNYIRSLSD